MRLENNAMAKSEISILFSVEQLADGDGYVDLRSHPLGVETVAFLRQFAERDKEILWFPSTHRIQFYAKGREKIRQLRQQQKAIRAASRYRFDDCEKNILIKFSQQPCTSGQKSLSHEEVAALGFPAHAIEVAYRSLHRKRLAHHNSLALVLEPEGLAVAEGVYWLTLNESYPDDRAEQERDDKPPKRPILSPFQKAIFPWFALLSNRWQPVPTEMTAQRKRQCTVSSPAVSSKSS